jgi:hypothetical protein
MTLSNGSMSAGTYKEKHRRYTQCADITNIGSIENRELFGIVTDSKWFLLLFR